MYIFNCENLNLTRVAPELKGKELDRIVIENRHKIHKLLHEEIDIIVADSRYGFIRSLVQGSVRQTRNISTTKSDQIIIQKKLILKNNVVRV